MTKTFTLVIITILVGVTSAKLTLVWEDNFDNIDESKWSHEVTGQNVNRQFTYNRNNRKNSYVEDGILYIKATPASDEMSDEEMRSGVQYDPMCNLEPCSVVGDPEGDIVKPMYSANLHTHNKFSIRYGRVEVKAKIPRGDWLKGAIWMMPEKDRYGGWPVSGEIDIIEASGNRNLTVANTGDSAGVDTIMSTFIFGMSACSATGEQPYIQYKSQLTDGTDYSDNFHTFAVERTPTSISFFVDNKTLTNFTPPKGGFWELGGYDKQHVGQVNPWYNGDFMAPFDEEFYLILKVSVGSIWFLPSWINEGGKPWDIDSGVARKQFYESQDQILKTWDRPYMAVDHVRVYEWSA